MRNGNMVQVYKTIPAMGDVHNNVPLTMFSEAYQQGDSAFIASRAFPTVPVTKQSDIYYIWSRKDFNRDEARKRAPGTPVQRGGQGLSTGSYSCDVWEWGSDIPDEVRANSDPGVNLDTAKTAYVMNVLNIKKEREFAGTFLGTSIWGTDITGVASGPSGSQVVQWNASASTPVADVEAGKMAVLLATGMKPNTLVLGAQVRSKLNTNADIIARINYGQTPGGPAIVTDAALAKVFGVDRILVSEAIYNTAAEGATESNAFIAGKVALLCYSNPSPGLLSASAGMTFAWSGFPGASAAGTLIRTQRDDKAYTDLIDGFMSFDQKVTAAALGYFFTAIIA